MGNELSQHVDQAQKTGILQLRNFKLSKVPPEISTVAQFLRTLDLSTNKIPQLPQNFFVNMKQLKSLNLSSNRLDGLPNDMGVLVKLETLNVSDNNLTQLPASLNQLKSLKQVNAAKNALRQLPRCLCELKQVDAIDLSGNKIEIIDDYVAESSCIELILNENQLRAISSAIARCARLKVLRIEHNVLEISAIPAELLANSAVSLVAFEGNLFTNKQFEQIQGYDKVGKKTTVVS